VAQFSRSVWLCLYLLVSGVPVVAQERLPTASPGETVAQLVRDVFSVETATRRGALATLQKLDNPGAIPGLIQALRFIRDEEAISATLNTLAKTRIGTNWNEWMLWQQAHPEIVPFAGYDAFKTDVMALIDPNFRLFLQPGVEHEIRLEEVVWGGVRKDGIPALINPIHIIPSEATYLEDDELVFGVSIKGDARAYPLRILDWHEMFNDIIGGVPVALAYCTLCGSGILYETHVPSRSAPLVFGSSGFLYRSNKLMYDRQTNSLWNQFSGRPVVGPLTDSGIELKVRPVAISSWKDWLKRHPDTKVLSLDTGHLRDYTPGRPYGEYFNSPELMFPALAPDTRLTPKDYVFALRVDGYEKAWPLSAFTNMPVISDRVGDLDLVLIGNTATRTVRAYRTDGRNFTASEKSTLSVIANNETWEVDEGAMINESGDRLVRLPGHIAYWFAWRQNNPTAPFYGD
jgi:hypothetical protein